MNNYSITPEILIKEGFIHVNKATMAGSEFWCWEKDNILLRYRANGLYRINPGNRLQNISSEIKLIKDLNDLE